MERHDKGQDLVLVASEPLTFERDDWVTVPTNCILSINKQTVLIHPVVDKYYQPDPSFSRSAAFVESKGLASKSPADKAIAVKQRPMQSMKPWSLAAAVVRSESVSSTPSDASGIECD